jgi:2-C-methyl-D-erythritol 2,4-cyclodiphosphate synthase
MTNDNLRIGQGIDIHPFAEGRKLILGGVEIPFDKGLLGHSDADALCHAIGDALLGAAALGDIGHYFPPSDPKWKDANSLELLAEIGQIIWKAYFRIVNVDVTLILEKPKIAPYREQMRRNIAQALKIDIDRVSIKATTSEKLGFTGREEGVTATAIALLRR